MPGLLYGEFILCIMVDGASELMPKHLRAVLPAVVLGMSAWAFYYWAPWIYALPLTAEGTSPDLLLFLLRPRCHRCDCADTAREDAS